MPFQWETNSIWQFVNLVRVLRLKKKNNKNLEMIFVQLTMWCQVEVNICLGTDVATGGISHLPAWESVGD
jgi:hypothetical protein